MSYYHPGGTLPKESPTYVTRQADQEFYDGLAKGEFCYVLNARQMGKSSLQVRTRQRLENDGVACAVVDLTKIGGHASEEAFYAGVIKIIADQLPQIQPFDLDTWWESHRLLSPLHHLATFLEEVLLVRIAPQQIVIFIDESDAILKFAGNGKEDFFSLIRTCYNDRPEKPAYQRLTFAILGVASPGDLIVDKKLTPFNIGRAIDLMGFQPAEVGPLEEGLRAITGQPAVVLTRVLYWTGGQPFLTQKLCHLLSPGEEIPIGEEVTRVDQMVQLQVLDHWEVQDEPTHLRHIRDRIFHEGGQQTGRLLELYQAILSAPLEEGIVATESRTQLELRLSGLVVKTGQGRLQVYNPIYARVFNLEWVAQALTLLRPYAQNLRNWQSTQEESRLLRGQALTEALEWARNKSLAEVDHEFLTASRLAEEKAGAQRRLQRFLWMALLVVLGLAGVAGWEWWLTLQQEKRLAVSLKETLRTQSLFLADLARQHREKEDFTSATLLALEALPKSVSQPDRPLVFEAETQLYRAVTQMRGRAILKGHGGLVNSATFGPSGQQVVTASEDNTARLWEVQSGQLLAVLKGHENTVWSATFSPSGQQVVTTSGDKTARLWEVPSGKLLAVLTGHEEVVFSATFSPGGQQVVTASHDKTARLWEVQSGKLLAVLKGHKDDVNSATFSPSGQQVVTTSGDKTARLWEVPSGKLLAVLTGHEEVVFSATFSPGGQQVVTASFDNTARLWEVQSGQLLAVLKGHENDVNSATFSPRGQQVVTASSDKTARLWEVQSGKLLAVLTGHENKVTSATFSPRGQQVVTASLDNTARLWEVQSGKLLAIFETPDEVISAKFSPNGQSLVTATGKEAWIWPLFPSTQALLEYARQVVPRQLNCRERIKFFLVEKGECR